MKFDPSPFEDYFSCCGFWNKCDMGRSPENCYYQAFPSITSSCNVYQRNTKVIGKQEIEDLDAAWKELQNSLV